MVNLARMISRQSPPEADLFYQAQRLDSSQPILMNQRASNKSIAQKSNFQRNLHSINRQYENKFDYYARNRKVYNLARIHPDYDDSLDEIQLFRE